MSCTGRSVLLYSLTGIFQFSNDLLGNPTPCDLVWCLLSPSVHCIPTTVCLAWLCRAPERASQGKWYGYFSVVGESTRVYWAQVTKSPVRFPQPAFYYIWSDWETSRPCLSAFAALQQGPKASRDTTSQRSFTTNFRLFRVDGFIVQALIKGLLDYSCMVLGIGTKKKTPSDKSLYLLPKNLPRLKKTRESTQL